MQVQNNIPTNSERRSLSDFVPLVFTFFACLVLLSLYQYLRLYVDGVLDGFLNKSLFLLILHNLGFAAIAGLVLAFAFNLLEEKKAGLGIKVVKITLFALLVVEGLLIEYYVRQYEILENNIFNLAIGKGDVLPVLSVVSIGVVIYFVFNYLYQRMSTVYRVVSKMYPFTIVLFSLFLAILNSDKKPINENKTQHFLVSVYENLTDFNTYEGSVKFPLVKKYQKDDDRLGAHFNLSEQKPNIVVLIIDGLGADFIGKKASYSGFTPFLEKLSQKSLYWENYLSNSGIGAPAMTSITGSLPFGEIGFTNADNFVHRQTLFSLLKKNGYQTAFYYGGNSALNHFDKFLEEEQVDLVLDKKGFGDGYTLQTEDGAGVTLGYPDKELFKKWSTVTLDDTMPKFEVFQTTSTKSPYAVPNLEMYEEQALAQLKSSNLSESQKRLVRKNTEIFASLLYMDEAMRSFITSFDQRPEYHNTIFIITGSHNLNDLPQYNELGRYKVPLLVFSPMLKHPQEIQTLASHADIAPSLVQLLETKYKINIPEQVAWLGDNLISDSVFSEAKSIPLFRDAQRVKEYVLGDHFISSRTVSKLDKNLKLIDSEDDAKSNLLKASLKEFRAINSYVVENDKLIPLKNSLVVMTTPEFSKTDLIWIESMFNGKDFDNAYASAKKLAFDKEWDRALLLCNYILTKIPSHADTEILMGRIYAWKTDYAKAERLLKKAIQKYPVYEDGYAALLDVYFWAKQPQKAMQLMKLVKSNNINSEEIAHKINRASTQLKEEATKKDQLVTSEYE